MIDFFTSSTFQTVSAALNSGFLKTLQLFFVTLIGAIPLGLVIAFGSMSRAFCLPRLRVAEPGTVLCLGHPGHAPGAADHRPVLCARHGGAGSTGPAASPAG